MIKSIQTWTIPPTNTAWLFFELYTSDAFRTVVELVSQDINGSILDHCPAGIHYIGLDMMLAKGVDLVVGPGDPLPRATEAADAVVTSSAFEHDVGFWDTFLELVRITTTLDEAVALRQNLHAAETPVSDL